jgi:GntR family transcriptional regulator
MLTDHHSALFIALSPASPDPMYKQVTDQIRDGIATGALQPGEKLPSIRELAKALDISVITTKRAYMDLEQEGLIMTRAGMGSFVAEVDHQQLRQDKLAEIVVELRRVLAIGRKFGISAEEIKGLIGTVEEESR